ncbi:MAG: primosomal protein N' [Cyanobacteria bacterium J06639_16]
MPLVSSNSPAGRPQWIEVLVDHPGAQGVYLYSLPDDLVVQPGDILSVPFGAQQVGAIAIQLVNQPAVDFNRQKIRPVDSVVSAVFFAPHYWELLQHVASYYQTPLIQVIRTALPPGLLAKSQRRIRLKREAIPGDQSGDQIGLSQSALILLRSLQHSATGDYTWQHLKKQTKAARSGLQQLLKQGWVESYLASPQPPRPKLRQAVSLTAAGPGNPDLTPRQREVVALLQRLGGELWLSDALQQCRTTSATLHKLAAQGYLVIEPREVLRTTQIEGQIERAESDRPKPLNPAQQAALDALLPIQTYTQVLLHGVTGSGKTEVYLQAIAPRLAAHQSTLVLVPEIGLTPQLTDRFRDRFGQKVCVYHSALSDGERYDTWRQMFSGAIQVIIGTRSAIFAPLPNLGLIILDEEHDSSFKQDQPAPCYHARTVARWRAELEDVPLLLGSATPSLESWVWSREGGVGERGRGGEGERGRGGDGNTVGASRRVPTAIDLQSAAKLAINPQNSKSSSAAAQSAVQNSKSPSAGAAVQNLYLSLPDRINARPMPVIQVVDMRQELHGGNRSIFSRRLSAALMEMKASGNQGLLFIHRRGHSSFVSCRSCGHVMDCPHCDVSLSHHKPYAAAVPTLRCHYCGYGQAQPLHCPACGSPYLKHFGSGTQRVVNELADQFPDLRCIRFDSDTTRTKGAHRALIDRFARGEADLLVGTQMLTKGLDLPQVTVVGILAADGLLYMNDYWASERAYQTLTQVAGRAGRGDHPGQVIMQTYTPDHPVIEALKQQDYAKFVAEELEQRQALAYPPWGQIVLLRFSGLEAARVEQTATAIAADLTQLLNQNSRLTYDLLGPAPAPILRVAQRYRWHILLKLPQTPAQNPEQIADRLPDLTQLRDRCPKGVSLTIDVDALNLS